MPRLMRLLLVAVLLGALSSNVAQAADMCTGTPMYQPQNVDSGGVINTFATIVEGKVTSLMQSLYNGFINDSGYTAAYYGALLLYVMLYGVMILFNMASLQPYEIMKRLFKIGILGAFVSPGSWGYFNTYVVQAAWGGMNEIMGIFSQIATGAAGGAAPVETFSKDPLMLVNALVQMVFSLKFFVLIVSTIFTGLSGVFYAFLIILAAIGILRAAIGATATYFKVMIALTFLLGIAPIFIPMALFSETKKIFQGWVQQVVGLILQPIMLFGFLAFFMVMIASTINAIMGIADYCWVQNDFVQGLPGTRVSFFSPQIGGQQGTNEVRTEGWFSSLPINVDDVLMLVVLSELAWRYSKYVADIAKDFGSGALDLRTTGGDVRSWSKIGGQDVKNQEIKAKEMVASDHHKEYRKRLAGTGSQEEADLDRLSNVASAFTKGASLRRVVGEYKGAEPKDKKQAQGKEEDKSDTVRRPTPGVALAGNIQKLKGQMDEEKDPEKKEALENKIKHAEEKLKEQEAQEKAKKEQERMEKRRQEHQKKESEKRKKEDEEKSKEEKSKKDKSKEEK